MTLAMDGGTAEDHDGMPIIEETESSGTGLGIVIARTAPAIIGGDAI
jgi:hypothetical protein